MRSLATLSLACVLGLSPGMARAFCQATTCEGGSTCDPEQVQLECGAKPLRWKRDCIGVALHQDASDEVEYATAKGILRAAFEAWEAADCGGGQPPGIHVEILNKVSCGKVEYNDDRGNVNVVVFRDDRWPHPDDDHQIALTTVHFEVNTGEIFDADIEVNAADFDLTTGNPVGYDLASVLTHEAGHFLGLGHTSDPNATMFSLYQAGTVDFRTLGADDVAGICAVYPPDDFDRNTCNPIPRHGFSAECGGKQPVVDCAASPGRDGDGRFTASALALSALAWIASRRRGRSRLGSSPTRGRAQSQGIV